MTIIVKKREVWIMYVYEITQHNFESVMVLDFDQ
jgi:hypothetical protein